MFWLVLSCDDLISCLCYIVISLIICETYVEAHRMILVDLWLGKEPVIREVPKS